MRAHIVPVSGSHYEVEDGHYATVSFQITKEMLDYPPEVNILGRAHQRYKLPDGYTALQVREEWNEGENHLRVTTIGARQGHYKFVPSEEASHG